MRGRRARLLAASVTRQGRAMTGRHRKEKETKRAGRAGIILAYSNSVAGRLSDITVRANIGNVGCFLGGTAATLLSGARRRSGASRAPRSSSGAQGRAAAAWSRRPAHGVRVPP